MKDILLVLCAILVFLGIAIKWDKLTSYIVLRRFNKYELCNDWIYEFAEEIRKKLAIKNKVFIAQNTKKKNFNADVSYYNNDILIVLHGNWKQDYIKFVICHELAHVKLKHREVPNNTLFITCLFLISVFSLMVFEYSFKYTLIEEYIGIIDAVAGMIIIIAFALWNLVHKRNYNKANCHREYAADLLAANLVGLKLAISAIRMLKDDKRTGFKSDHPSNENRIKYLLKNIEV